MKNLLVALILVATTATASYAQGFTNPGGWGRGQGGVSPCSNCDTSNSSGSVTIRGYFIGNAYYPVTSPNLRAAMAVARKHNARVVKMGGPNSMLLDITSVGQTNNFNGWDGTYDAGCGCYPN